MENSVPPIGLAALGFSFNPFEHLEASADPYLQEYLVGHEISSVAWDESPAFLFAPPGGGKTAMRIYTFRSCWLESGKRNKFPIPYYLPYFFENSRFETLDDHLAAIVHAGATALLLSIAYRPRLFWGLDRRQQTRLLEFLQGYLPGDLLYLLDTLEQTGSPASLAKTLDHSFALPDPPVMEEISRLCMEIKKLDFSRVSPNISPREQIHLLEEIVLSDLGFRAIFVLLDGIDGFPDLGQDSTKAAAKLKQLYQHNAELAKEGLMLKSFLPIDTHAEMQPYLSVALAASLEWNIPSLAELLRKRVYVATRGRFGSLDAVSSPELRDVELALARVITPLPREGVLIVRRLLDIVIADSGTGPARIEKEDLDAAIQWYTDEQAPIAASLVPNLVKVL